MQSLVKVKKRNRYTAVKSATAIQRSKARPLYSGLSPDEASFIYGIAVRRGDPPPLGGGPRGSPRRPSPRKQGGGVPSPPNPRACFFVDASLSLTARLTPGKNFRGLDCVTVDNDTPDLL